MEDFYDLSLEIDDVKRVTKFLHKNAAKLEENEEILEVFRRNCYGVIRCAEIDRKSGKKQLSSFVSAIQKLKFHEKVAKMVYNVLLSLPMMIQARWELLALLLGSGLIKQMDEVIFKEIMACASDQDLAARCSSVMLQISSNSDTCDKTAAIIFKGLTSPVAAVRSNVHRSWLCRIITLKNSQKCVETLLKLCKKSIKTTGNCSKILPISFRELPGLTCVDLQWRAILDEEPGDFSAFCYFSVLLSLKNASSQVHIQIPANDEFVLAELRNSGSLDVLKVCSKYKIYPEPLENWILEHFSPEMMEYIDFSMLKTFSAGFSQVFEEKKLEICQEKLEKFYPAEDLGRLNVHVDLSKEKLANETLEQFLQIQHESEEYPSVAGVMENLSKQNIDERLFCQKICLINDIMHEKYSILKEIRREMYTEFIFKIITRIPLRSVVDYVGATLKTEALQNPDFKNQIYQMSCQLLRLDKENARPLSLYHCFIGTCQQQDTTARISEIWAIIRGLKCDVKKRKMTEMLAKVVTSSEIQIDPSLLSDMTICSLGLHPTRFNTESTQLFVASISKLLDFRNESERIMLFQATANTPTLMDLISSILSRPSTDFSISGFQMILYFFTRFHIGSMEFYPYNHLLIITKIINFCHWSIRKFAKEPMILSISVDAICGFLPWSYLSEIALNGLEVENDPVEQLIAQNLKHNRFCVLLAEHDKQDTYLTIEDFEKLPKSEFIVEILRKKDAGNDSLNDLGQKLREITGKSMNFEEKHANLLACGILFEKSVEIMENAEKSKDLGQKWKNQYPPRGFLDNLMESFAATNSCINPEEIQNWWLEKCLGMMEIVRKKIIDFY